jgi:hypothetical protein
MGDGKSQRSRSTWEAGEPTQGTPWRKGERRTTEPLRGKTMETPISGTVLTRLQRIASGQRIRGPRNRMREFCTSGSVGGLGG